MMNEQKTVPEFRGEYFFLSNFFVAPFVYDRVRYNTVEAAFQAAKCAKDGSFPVFLYTKPQRHNTTT